MISGEVAHVSSDRTRSIDRTLRHRYRRLLLLGAGDNQRLTWRIAVIVHGVQSRRPLPVPFVPPLVEHPGPRGSGARKAKLPVNIQIVMRHPLGGEAAFEFSTHRSSI